MSKAFEQGHFNERHIKLLTETLNYIKDYLAKTNDRMMIVHADLGKSNLIYHNGIITPIDFSLSGFCIPEMDLASAFSHINDETLNQEILSGYRSICIIEHEYLGIEVCFCLQILLFIVAQHNKYAKDSWFQDMVDSCCEKYFTPLIANTAILGFIYAV